jgi:hypothetical protein
MSLSDDILMAYVDGELSAEDRARVEAEMRTDADVARRVAEHQKLRNGLRAAFDGVLREPVSDRLLAAARGERAAPVDTGVADFAAAAASRDAKREARARRQWSWPEWGAMAASLLIGVIVARFSLRSPEAAPFVSQQGQLVAQGGLAEALTNQLASTQPPESAAQIGVTFRTKDGRFCRSFTTGEGEALAGLACREGNVWRIDTLARTDASLAEYRQAGSALPVAVVSAIEQQIDGEPLDAASEARVKETGWQRAAAP